MISRSCRTYLSCSLGSCSRSLARAARVSEVSASSSSCVATEILSSYWLSPSAEADSGECFFSISISRLANSLLRAIQFWAADAPAFADCLAVPAAEADWGPGPATRYADTAETTTARAALRIGLITNRLLRGGRFAGLLTSVLRQPRFCRSRFVCPEYFGVRAANVVCIQSQWICVAFFDSQAIAQPAHGGCQDRGHGLHAFTYTLTRLPAFRFKEHLWVRRDPLDRLAGC